MAASWVRGCRDSCRAYTIAISPPARSSLTCGFQVLCIHPSPPLSIRTRAPLPPALLRPSLPTSPALFQLLAKVCSWRVGRRRPLVICCPSPTSYIATLCCNGRRRTSGARRSVDAWMAAVTAAMEQRMAVFSVHPQTRPVASLNALRCTRCRRHHAYRSERYRTAQRACEPSQPQQLVARWPYNSSVTHRPLCRSELPTSQSHEVEV